MHLITGTPFQGIMLRRLEMFLKSCDLEYDASIRFTAAIMEDDEIIATGSLDGATLKCIAVSPQHQGEDLTAQVMTVLLQEAMSRGQKQLMLYTKPRNQYLFRGFGFHPVIRTADCLMMENRRDGLKQFLTELEKPSDSAQPIGAIVANCNPFTRGHRYLIETAASECAWLHLFVLSENKGMFTPVERLQMVKAGCRDLKNVLVHPTGPYMVSSATFPSYFIKDKARVDDIHCELDICLFGEKIAPALNISRRYVGTEPNCAVTAQYNAQMKRLLPEYGIELIEIERRTAQGAAISASRVRALIEEGRFDQLSALLPESSIEIIQSR